MPLNVEFVTVRGPVLTIAPPARLVVAVLPVNIEFVTVRDAEPVVWMPPPWTAVPLLMVRPDRVTVPAVTLNTRNEEAPLTVTAPAPATVRSVEMSGRAELKVTVPATLKVMVSAPDPAAHSPAAAPEAASVLAAVIASRRVQAPSLAATSASELTVIEAASADDTPIDPTSPRAASSAPKRRSTAGDMSTNLHPLGSSGVTPTDAFGLAIVVSLTA